MASPIPVNFTISAACLKELSTALGKATGTDPKTVTVSRPCAEETWNALMAALKGAAPPSKKKGGKTTTSVRQKSGRPTASSITKISSGRSGSGG